MGFAGISAGGSDDGLTCGWGILPSLVMREGMGRLQSAGISHVKSVW